MQNERLERFGVVVGNNIYVLLKAGISKCSASYENGLTSAAVLMYERPSFVEHHFRMQVVDRKRRFEWQAGFKKDKDLFDIGVRERRR